jgi:dTMP kinase
MSKGALIAVEGLDGTGKTYLMELLKEEFDHPEIIFTREPYGIQAREIMRGAASATINNALEIVTMDRQRHIDEVIKPALDRGCLIITDRYYGTTAVYQACTIMGVPQLFRSQANLWPRPDLWIYVTARAETILKRTAFRREEEQQTTIQIFQRQARYGSILLDGLMGPALIVRNDEAPQKALLQMERALVPFL